MGKCLIYLFAILVILIAGCSEQPVIESNVQVKPPGKLKSHKTFTPEMLKEDFTVLTTMLDEVHPDLYRLIPEDSLKLIMTDLENELDHPMEYLEFLRLVARLFTEIGCVNTQWGHAKAYLDFRNENIPVFPLSIKICNDHFLIGKGYSLDYGIQERTEILEMNGEKMSVYLEKNYPLLPVDGKIRTLQNRWLESFFPNHHSNFWGQPDTFHLTLLDVDGNTFEKSVPALLPSQVNRAGNESSLDELPLQFNLDGDIAVLVLKSFNKKFIENHGQQYGAFLDSSFRTISNEKIKALIIDLRGGGWGEVSYGASLYSYLANEPFTYIEEIILPGNTRYSYKENITKDASMKVEKIYRLTGKVRPRKINYTGDLYLITDGWVVNSKGFFCARIRKRTNTFFVGEECGASLFGMNGNPLSLKLPNTGIGVMIPTIQLMADREDYHVTQGVPVDFPMDNFDTEKMVSLTKERIRNN